MARNHIGRFLSGPRGLRKIFKRNPILRRTISPKERGQVLKTLGKFKGGGGLDTGEELQKASSEWSNDTDDLISRSEARIIKRELRKNAKNNSDTPSRSITGRSRRPRLSREISDRMSLDHDRNEGRFGTDRFSTGSGTHFDDPRDESNWQDPPTPGGSIDNNSDDPREQR